LRFWCGSCEALGANRGRRMNKSDLFSYLSAFVTIVLAVAITDMIQSTHRLIRARRRVKWDFVPLIFAATITIGVVSEFFSLWDIFAVSKVTLPLLLWMLAVPTLYALLAYSVLPDDIPQEGLDLTIFYTSERRTWIVIFTLAIVLDIARSVALIGHRRDWLLEYASYIAVLLPFTIVGLIMMWIGRSRRWHVAGVLLQAGVTIYGSMGWAISTKP